MWCNHCMLFLSMFHVVASPHLHAIVPFIEQLVPDRVLHKTVSA